MRHSPPVNSISNDNFRGSLWMIAAMAGFAIEDALFKRATHTLPVGEVLMLFGAGGAIAFAALVRRSGRRVLHRDALAPSMRVRAAFELVGRLFYFLAISLTPMSAATSILQATPVVVVLGARIYFRERIGWRRWCAVIAGLTGVIIILHPTATDFSNLSLLTLIGMLGFAGRDLASRAAPRTLGTWHLGFYGFVIVVLAGILYGAWEGRAFVWPSEIAVLSIAGAVAIGVFAYAALMKSMRTGDVATVAPFRYTRLFFGIALGVLLFDEHVDATMLQGCVIIVAGGLMIAWHNFVTARTPQRSAAH